MDRAPSLALGVAKPEGVAIAAPDQPAARDTPAGILGGHAVTALHEMEARPVTDNASGGGATYEHCESVETYHEISVVGLTP